MRDKGKEVEKDGSGERKQVSKNGSSSEEAVLLRNKTI
jgi:hypothetical protein